MLTINNRSDYGLLIISKLLNNTDYVSLSKLVHNTNLPQRFIARVAADLVRSGILASREGKVGGYRLAKNPKSVTLYEFLKIFEEDMRLTKCQRPDYHCDFEKMCSHNNFFRIKLTNILVKELNNWTLMDVLKH